ncbi:N-acetyl-D-muramate 6-phosphate phosphatase [Gammaproteobacteria bacterium]|nr:N-acetyl-D-muramate 6-phosphate phosphatase [Gammaproteobacteria bacterium]
MTSGLSTVLFDLDGTLLDTAPDMVSALNDLLREESARPMPFEVARCHVSNGVLGLLRLAFGDVPDDERERLQQRFIDLYSRQLARQTRLFQGMDRVLATLEAAGVPWGVVTNKPGRLTEPLLAALALRRRCAAVVSGDTTPERKPHPQPLRHALAEIGADARSAVYVGDAARDVSAGRAAGMRTVAALYGYIPPGEDPQAWGADHHIEAPEDLLAMIEARADRMGRR